MTLLSNFPHKCKIERITWTSGTLAGKKPTPVSEQTDVACWEQQASSKEIKEFQKRGISIARKIYFLVDPAVTEKHTITITERQGTAIASASQISLKVRSESLPDASAGLGVVYKVMVEERTGEDT